MNKRVLLSFGLSLLIMVAGGLPLSAAAWRKHSTELKIINAELRGKIIDHTANHNKDNRIWSRVLGERRDMYAYLPPNFDPRQRYPLIVVLHGVGQDEQMFLDVAKWIDDAINDCLMPPCIAVCPDGTFTGEPHPGQAGSLFLNSSAGDYEDYLLADVWDFTVNHYPIRHERHAHVLMGYSLGGYAAFSLAMRHRYAFGTVVGLSPAVNMRWTDPKGNYQANFNPRKWGWRTSLDDKHNITLFNHSVASLRMFYQFAHLYESPYIALKQMSCLNPIELVDRTKLKNHELEMYVTYGGMDELNMDAQVESFLYLCHFRGINVGVGFDPKGDHSMETAYRLFPGVAYWLGPRLAPFSPGWNPNQNRHPTTAQQHKNVAQGPRESRNPAEKEPSRLANPSRDDRIPTPRLPAMAKPPAPRANDLGPKAGKPLNTPPPALPNNSPAPAANDNTAAPASPTPTTPAPTTTAPAPPTQSAPLLPPSSLPQASPTSTGGTPPAFAPPPGQTEQGPALTPPPGDNGPSFLPDPSPSLGNGSANNSNNNAAAPPPATAQAAPPQNGIIQTQSVFYPWR